MVFSRAVGFSCGLGLLAVFGISLQLACVKSYPLGFESRGIGIHERQPSYLPTYNGIFSLHALNYTPSTTDKLFLNSIESGKSEDAPPNSAASNSSFENLIATDESELSTSEDKLEDPSRSRPSPEIDSTGFNEIESADKDNNEGTTGSEFSTFPQIQVITKTISGASVSSDSSTKDSQKQVSHKITGGTTAAQPTLDDELTLIHSNNNVSFLEGSLNDPIEAGDGGSDIFDHLMKTIQGHWLDFVGKMKLSVLDVWKSISQHMMERLESFAATL